MSPFENALILTGPTASGKTALALDLAERLDAEIVALDSMTVYRGMDIGTAKPTAAERARVPHHLIDVLDPWESLTVAWWLEHATAACRDITSRGKRPLFVGGTPFYLKALFMACSQGPRRMKSYAEHWSPRPPPPASPPCTRDSRRLIPRRRHDFTPTTCAGSFGRLRSTR